MSEKILIPSFEEIRIILKEVSISQKKTDQQMRETDRKMRETDRKMQETDRKMQETDRKMQETSLLVRRLTKDLKRLEDLFTGQWGKLMEALVKGDLVKLLNKKGIKIDHNITNAKKNSGERRFEFDIISINGKEVAVTEVKTTLGVRDVDYFLSKLERFTYFMPEYKGKKIYGAVAFLKANGSSEIYAESKGLFVIRATGSSSSIINKEGFKPRVF